MASRVHIESAVTRQTSGRGFRSRRDPIIEWTSENSLLSATLNLNPDGLRNETIQFSTWRIVAFRTDSWNVFVSGTQTRLIIRRYISMYVWHTERVLNELQHMRLVFAWSWQQIFLATNSQLLQIDINIIVNLFKWRETEFFSEIILTRIDGDYD